MNLSEINIRIELLRDVFAFSLLHNRTLSIGQRICLSQERAALLTCKEDLNYDFDARVEPRYRLPNHLEKNVQEIAIKIKDTNWIKPAYEPLF